MSQERKLFLLFAFVVGVLTWQLISCVAVQLH